MRFPVTNSLALLTSTILALTTVVSAAGPPPSLCDKYSTALFKSTDSKSQLTLLTALVNTAVIGSYEKSGGKPGVLGILSPKASFNGKKLNLVKYFDGSIKSSNFGGKPRAINWLDGGGAAPLMENKPANDPKSAQYVLLTHLYEYFGTALGCSSQGKKDGVFKKYGGSTSMYKVHKFMHLSNEEVSFFISQVGSAALSFGVTKEDATAVGELLHNVFGFRCSPPISFPPESPKSSQSICTAKDCPLDPHPQCPKKHHHKHKQHHKEEEATFSGGKKADTRSDDESKTTKKDAETHKESEDHHHKDKDTTSTAHHHKNEDKAEASKGSSSSVTTPASNNDKDATGQTNAVAGTSTDPSPTSSGGDATATMAPDMASTNTTAATVDSGTAGTSTIPTSSTNTTVMDPNMVMNSTTDSMSGNTTGMAMGSNATEASGASSLGRRGFVATGTAGWWTRPIAVYGFLGFMSFGVLLLL